MTAVVQFNRFVYPFRKAIQLLMVAQAKPRPSWVSHTWH